MCICFGALQDAGLECIALFEVSKQLQTSENSSNIPQCVFLQSTPWRNGSASDTRSESRACSSHVGVTLDPYGIMADVDFLDSNQSL